MVFDRQTIRAGSRERILMRSESEEAPPVVPLTKDELDENVERLRTRTAV